MEELQTHQEKKDKIEGHHIPVGKEELLDLDLKHDDTQFIHFVVFVNEDNDVNTLELDRIEYADNFSKLPHVHDASSIITPMAKTTTFSLAILELLQDLGLEGNDKILVTLVPKAGTKILVCKSQLVGGVTRDLQLPSEHSGKKEAVRLLGPPARFEASKLKVAFTGEEIDTYSRVVPRTYTLSHCDFTANLTLTISNIINLDQLKGWYNKDDVVAEWTQVNGNMCLDVHCYVSGPNLLQELAAEFRYLIFSKELPLVLEAVLYGDSVLFKENPELTNALVRVFFHSSSKKYNHVECWGPLKDAVKGRPGDHINGLSSAARQDSRPHNILGSAKSIFQALATFLL
nr:protein STAY-GREEN LIKE, chloroplastic [Ipomoea batatas]